MINVLDKPCRAHKTHILYLVIFFFEIRAVYEIMWKNIVQPDRLHMYDNIAHAHCMLDV
jgi:hypothetical protein